MLNLIKKIEQILERERKLSPVVTKTGEVLLNQEQIDDTCSKIEKIIAVLKAKL